MSSRFSTVLLILVMVAGLCLLLYPTVSDYWNSFHQSKAIAGYAEAVAGIAKDTYTHLWSDAQAYNQELAKTGNIWRMTEAQQARYNSLLNVAGNGVIGYIEIPSIHCSLPIYHGTADEVLQIAIGHIESTSLPIGGTGTHSVLSGHRGLPSAKLFTNLDQLQPGDLFMLRILDETLTYEVDQILIVLPNELDPLAIDPQADLCTLVTCTPYGVNSHRLLVRGHRVANTPEEQTIRVTADAMQIEPHVVAPVVAAPMLLILLIILLIPKKHRDAS